MLLYIVEMHVKWKMKEMNHLYYDCSYKQI